MKVSIITSIYRGDAHLARFLKEAVAIHKTLLDKDITPEHLLIINDPTPLELELTSHLSKPFRVIVVPREPIYATWNRGVQESTSPFVCFWNVDDTRFAEGVVDGVYRLLESNSDLAYFPFKYKRYIKILGVKILAKIKTFTPPEFDKEIFVKEMHLGPHFMVRRDLFDRIGFFDESFRIAGDFEFQVRAAKRGARFLRILTTSGIFRNDGTTLSGSRSKLHSEENACAIKSI